MRKFRAALRTQLYQFLVALRFPLPWQAAVLPKHLLRNEVCVIPLKRIELYSTSDPSPPKGSARFCFKSTEESKMRPITSVFNEMTEDNNRACVHNSLRDIFLNGRDFQETSQYKRMVRGLAEGIVLYHCHSREDIDQYFENLHKAYQSIKESGYRSQEELGNSPGDEVRIHITGDGALCLGSTGNHRFRIAELLEVEEIPCNVYGVNIDWLVSLSSQSQLPPHVALLRWMKEQQSGN